MEWIKFFDYAQLPNDKQFLISIRKSADWQQTKGDKQFIDSLKNTRNIFFCNYDDWHHCFRFEYPNEHGQWSFILINNYPSIIDYYLILDQPERSKRENTTHCTPQPDCRRYGCQ